MQITDLENLPLDDLSACCRAEAAKFLRGEPNRQEFALEVFRRAVCDRNDGAWALLIEMYRGLLLSQLNRNPYARELHEDPDFWVNRTFGRFWSAVGADRFGMFADLPAILAYLKMCLHSVIVDDVRARHDARCVSLEAIPSDAVVGGDAADEALGGLAGRDLWRAILSELQSESEQIVAHLSFVRGLRPSQIQTRHPDLFQNVADIYRVKRNIVERLRHRLPMVAQGNARLV
jgi:hypothetical protein